MKKIILNLFTGLIFVYVNTHIIKSLWNSFISVKFNLTTIEITDAFVFIVLGFVSVYCIPLFLMILNRKYE